MNLLMLFGILKQELEVRKNKKVISVGWVEEPKPNKNKALNRFRHLSKDYEVYSDVSEAMIYSSLILSV